MGPQRSPCPLSWSPRSALITSINRTKLSLISHATSLLQTATSGHAPRPRRNLITNHAWYTTINLISTLHRPPRQKGVPTAMLLVRSSCIITTRLLTGHARIARSWVSTRVVNPLQRTSSNNNSCKAVIAMMARARHPRASQRWSYHSLRKKTWMMRLRRRDLLRGRRNCSLRAVEAVPEEESPWLGKMMTLSAW